MQESLVFLQLFQCLSDKIYIKKKKNSFPKGYGNGNSLQCSCRRIPWTEEPDRLQSMGLQRVGHD